MTRIRQTSHFAKAYVLRLLWYAKKVLRAPLSANSSSTVTPSEKKDF